MVKFAKTFRGVKAGEIYPTEFEPGDDCPPELEDAARACGVLGSQAEYIKKAQGAGILTEAEESKARRKPRK